MGCIILMAVRHRDLDQVAKIDSNSLDLCYNINDYSPKYFDVGSSMNPDSPNRNVVISQYYESTGQAVLVVTKDFMMRPSAMVLCHSLGDGTVGSLVPDINSALKIRKTKLHAVEGLSRPEQKGDPVSLFGLSLDTFSSFQRNPHAMEDIAHYCLTTEARSRTFGHGIELLGTLGENQSALVLADRWWFKAAAIPSFELQCDEEEQQRLRQCFEEDKQPRGLSHADSEFMQKLFFREFMAGFGYEAQPIVRTRKAKTTQQEKANG